MGESQNNKRIAKNTLFLYMRMLLTMVISLYTSRVTLATLGVVDYGIYNVVGGVISMFAFLNSSLSSSTQRFLTFSLGQGDFIQLKKVFTASLNIHIILSLLIVLLGETLGLWFLNNKLVIPTDRVFAANMVYQLTIFMSLINIIQVPFDGTIIAHEKMEIFAYFSLLDIILKLAVVFILMIVDWDKMILLAILYSLVVLFRFILYVVYCKRHFIEIGLRFFYKKTLYKQLVSFAGWNLFGAVAVLSKDQGLNILLNLFFGPIVNAARTVSYQVSSAIANFMINFQTAINPQVVKYYASNELNDMERLVYRGSKLSFILTFFLGFPAALNIDFLLDIWLVKAPNNANIFIILLLIDNMIWSIFGSPMANSLQATGNIKKYQIIVGCIVISILPISYLALKLGCEPQMVFVIGIFITLISGVMRYKLCVSQVGFHVRLFLKMVVKRVVYILLFSMPIPLVVKYFYNASTWHDFLIVLLTTLIISAVVIYTVGLEKEEKLYVRSVLNDRFKRWI